MTCYAPEKTVPSASGPDRISLEQIRSALEVREDAAPAIIGTRGEIITMPGWLTALVRLAISFRLRGLSVSLLPAERKLTPTEAAHVLNVSRTFVMKLIRNKDLKYSKIGNRHYIRRNDLLKLKEKFRADADSAEIALALMDEEDNLVNTFRSNDRSRIADYPRCSV